MPGVVELPHALIGAAGQRRLLESGESLSGLWIARYPDSGKERKRILGVLRCPRLDDDRLNALS